MGLEVRSWCKPEATGVGAVSFLPFGDSLSEDKAIVMISLENSSDAGDTDSYVLKVRKGEVRTSLICFLELF